MSYKYALGGLLLASVTLLLNVGCTYNIGQQQNKSSRTGKQSISSSRSGYRDDGNGYGYSYPDNGYSYRGGPIGPAYSPEAWNAPTWEAWRYRVY